MNGYDVTAVVCGLVTIVILSTMNFYIKTDIHYNETRRKEIEEETKRKLHGDS